MISIPLPAALLVQKPKQPQRDLIPNTGFDIIRRDKTIGNELKPLFVCNFPLKTVLPIPLFLIKQERRFTRG
jgi:hypothetical protein